MKPTDTDRLMVFILCGVFFWSAAVIANADEEKATKVIMLWPKDAVGQGSKGMGSPKPDRGDGHIRLTDVTKPSLRYFPASVTKKPGPTVILCPGGGYNSLVTTKMTPIAKWLNGHGISAFILIYRVPKKRKDAFQDIQRAVRIVRSRASEWNIDPRRIGVMGSSAGGHLAARVSTGFDITTYQEVDEIDGVSCKPDFTVLLYPAYMNKGKELSKELTVSNEISPTLIVSAKDDNGFFPGSPIYSKALKEAGASVRVHFFEKGGHGFSLRPKHHPLSTWPDLCLKWFRDMKIIEEEGIVFVEAPGAYAAVRVGQSGYTLSEKILSARNSLRAISRAPSGWVITLKDEYAPVILEVMAKTDVKSFSDFKKKVKDCKPQYQGTMLNYQSIYGDTLTLDTSYKQSPTVNGEPINYSIPEKVFESPFLNSEYDSVVVTIEKGSRKRVLDFNKSLQGN